MRPMKKVISFDLDGTLVNAGYGDMVWNYGIPLEYSKKYGISLDEAKAFTRKQYESVGDGDLLWYEIDYWLTRFQLSVLSEELLTRYESQIKPIPYARKVLSILGQKYTLIIASNAARIFVEKELDHIDFRHYFAHIISATTDYKMVKKEDRFFVRLCEYLKVSPTEIVHVGDHPVFDHDTPSSLGIESYYFVGEEHPEDRTGTQAINGRRSIRSLNELLERL
jgi:putative hydrolase of the HAD superfamily